MRDLVPLAHWLVATAVVAVGSALQGSMGFGLGLLAAPLLLLVEPRFVPAPLLLASGVLTILLTHRERRDVRWPDLKWSLSGRVLGTLPALAMLAIIPAERVGIACGALIVLGVVMSVAGWHFEPRPGALVGAGALSGFMGTMVSIGGPPIALVYQYESGPSIRGTLSAFFVVGVALSLIGLGAVGHFGRTEALLAAALLPGVLAGYWLSHHTARWADRGYIRPALLLASGVSAVAVIVKYIH